MMEEAVEERGGGCIIHIKVKTGNNRCFPAGYDEWRKRIELEIDEEPVRGKANRAIVELLSEYFDVKREDVEIVYGEKSKEKGILIKRSKTYILSKLR
jgi:uncharacterized protein (TIGR00251 family)